MADDWTAPEQRIANDVVTATIWNEQGMDNLTALYNAVSGDAQATAEVIHQHKSGTYASRPAAGNVGRIYWCNDLMCALLDDGTNWQILPPPAQLADYQFDDFFHRPADPATGYAGWTGKSDDATGSVLPVDGDSSVLRLSHGTVANKRTWIIEYASGIGHYKVQASRIPCVVEFKAKEATSDGKKFCGLVGAIPATGNDPANFIGFWNDGVNPWECVCADGAENSFETTTNDASFHIFRFDILATDSVKFYIDNSLETELTTNIPTTELTLFYMIDSTATSAKNLDLDYSMSISARA